MYLLMRKPYVNWLLLYVSDITQIVLCIPIHYK